MSGQTAQFANGSEIRVAVSFRSATTHRLHISEYGKICAKYPQRAEEIQTGTLPSVHPQLGGQVTIESTAEGAAGGFYDLCTQAQAETVDAEREGRKLSPIQYKFHFYAWWKDPKNAIEPIGLGISDDLLAYFADLAQKHNIHLTPEQQAWYANTRDGAAGLGARMKREHPSTVSEAFEAAVQGAVFGEEVEQARTDGRIGFYPWIPSLPVYTFWDLGVRNSTAVGYFQFPQGEARVIDYYCKRGRGASYHAAQVEAKPYNYHEHHMPHDVMHTEKGSGIVLKDTYQSLLKAPIHMVERPRLKEDSITALADMFGMLTFHAKTCSCGKNEENLIKAMGWYRYDWDEDHAVWSKEPIGDWSADPADMMQTMAMQFNYGRIGGKVLGFKRPQDTDPRTDNDEQTESILSLGGLGINT
jgi:hypothetical protein